MHLHLQFVLLIVCTKIIRNLAQDESDGLHVLAPAYKNDSKKAVTRPRVAADGDPNCETIDVKGDRDGSGGYTCKATQKCAGETYDIVGCSENHWKELTNEHCSGSCHQDTEGFCGPRDRPHSYFPHPKCDWFNFCRDIFDTWTLQIHQVIVEAPCASGHYSLDRKPSPGCVPGPCNPTPAPPGPPPAPPVTQKPLPPKPATAKMLPTTKPVTTMAPTKPVPPTMKSITSMLTTKRPVTTVPPKKPVTTMPPNWEYYFSEDKATWDEAKIKCAAKQGKLLVLFTEDDNKHVAELQKAHKPPFPDRTVFWSGAIQRNDEVYFEEPTERELDAYDDIVDWDINHDSGEGCIALDYPKFKVASVWQRYECSMEFNYICIKDTKLTQLANG